MSNEQPKVDIIAKLKGLRTLQPDHPQSTHSNILIGGSVTNARGWDGVVKNIKYNPPVPHNPTGKYYMVYWQERANHHDKAVARQPICGHTPDQIWLKSSAHLHPAPATEAQPDKPSYVPSADEPSPVDCEKDPLFHYCIPTTGETLSIGSLVPSHMIPQAKAINGTQPTILRMFTAYTPRGLDAYAVAQYEQVDGKPKDIFHLGQISSKLPVA